MIWTGGRVVADGALTIPTTDRALEHGLGLFETLRTWRGRPVLLGRHLARLARSAEALGLPLGPSILPDPAAVAALVEAEGVQGDCLLRITLTGGQPPALGPTAWMVARPLPPPFPEAGARLVLARHSIGWYDPMARHKALNYWSRRLAFEQARAAGADEALVAGPDGRVWEASRMNVFVVRGRSLLTPGRDGPLVAGVMRGLVLERAPRHGLEAAEADLGPADVDAADEVFLTNSVRGIVPVGRTPGGALAAPGPWTRLLWLDISGWLARGGGDG